MYLYLEDGAVFKGRGVTSCRGAVGLVSYYTGVVGYQEILSDPSNHAKIILFTYPEIGNYGVNPKDAESKAPTASGAVAKEYCPYHSNFRAQGSLKDYLDKAAVPLMDQVDTRAVLLAIREKGEMWGLISPEEIDEADLKAQIDQYRSQLSTERVRRAADGHFPAEAKLKAAVIDFGAPESFYRTLQERGVVIAEDEADADLVIVAPLPFYAVEDAQASAAVKSCIGKKTVLGIADGAALVASACGIKPGWMGFGHHGVNLPARYFPTGRREITVQNHHYIVKGGGGVEVLFENVNDGTPEGYRIPGERVAGVSFMPDAVWFEDIMRSLEVM